jgi:hypothetical protein
MVEYFTPIHGYYSELLPFNQEDVLKYLCFPNNWKEITMKTMQRRFRHYKLSLKLTLSGFLIGLMMVLIYGFGSSAKSQEIWTRHHIGSINGPICVQTADMNSDGLMDVIAAGYYANLIMSYANPLWAPELIGGVVKPTFHKVADLDRDGDLDVIVAAGGLAISEAVVWFENTPGGWVKRIIDNTILISGYGAECLDLFDFSGDDTLDVVAAGPQIVWFEWPNWTPHIIDPEPGDSLGGCSYLCVGDINGDMNMDLVAAVWYDPSSWILGSLVWYNLTNGTKDTIEQNLGVSYGIAVSDIDNDSDNDVIATSFGWDWVRWYENQNQGSSWLAWVIDPYLNAAAPVIAVDADQDNDMDIVAGGAYNPGWVGWYRNNLPNWEEIQIGELLGCRSLAVAHINEDPPLDLVACGHGADSVVWYQNPFFPSRFKYDETEVLIFEPALNQNYPNPFNPTTTILFDLPKTSKVSLKVFNILGEEVATLVSDRLSSGSYSYEWDARDLASGVYLYQLKTGDYIETKKMILMR